MDKFFTTAAAAFNLDPGTMVSLVSDFQSINPSARFVMSDREVSGALCKTCPLANRWIYGYVSLWWLYHLFASQQSSLPLFLSAGC